MTTSTQPRSLIHRSVVDLVNKISKSTNHAYNPKVMETVIRDNPLRGLYMGTKKNGGLTSHYFYVSPMIISPNLDYCKKFEETTDGECTQLADYEIPNLPNGDDPNIVDYLFVTPPTIASMDFNTSSQLRQRKIYVEGYNSTKNLAYENMHNVYEFYEGRSRLCNVQHSETNDVTELPNLDLATNYISAFFKDYANRDLVIDEDQLKYTAERLGLESIAEYFNANQDKEIRYEVYTNNEDYDRVDSSEYLVLEISFIGIYHLQKEFLQTYYPDVNLYEPSMELMYAGLDFWDTIMTPSKHYDPENPYMGHPTGSKPKSRYSFLSYVSDHMIHAIFGETVPTEDEFKDYTFDKSKPKFVLTLVDRETNSLLTTIKIHELNNEHVDNTTLSPRGIQDLEVILGNILKMYELQLRDAIIVKFNESENSFEATVNAHIQLTEDYWDQPNVTINNYDGNDPSTMITVVYMNYNTGEIIGSPEDILVQLPNQMLIDMRNGSFYQNAHDHFESVIAERTEHPIKKISQIPTAEDSNYKILVELDAPKPTTKPVKLVFISNTGDIVETIEKQVSIDTDLNQPEEVSQALKIAEVIAEIHQSTEIFYNVEKTTFIKSVYPTPDVIMVDVKPVDQS